MFDFYLKYIGSNLDLQDIVDLKVRGLSSEEIEGYLDFFQYDNKYGAQHEQNGEKQ